ncbi:hypothetical protein HispidOSU_003121 [Sigmodon hispidus]
MLQAKRAFEKRTTHSTHPLRVTQASSALQADAESSSSTTPFHFKMSQRKQRNATCRWCRRKRRFGRLASDLRCSQLPPADFGVDPTRRNPREVHFRGSQRLSGGSAPFCPCL